MIEQDLTFLTTDQKPVRLDQIEVIGSDRNKTNAITEEMAMPNKADNVEILQSSLPSSGLVDESMDFDHIADIDMPSVPIFEVQPPITDSMRLLNRQRQHD